ncbi:MAG: hypothetical protein JNJ99_07270 [Crocinitomicaceae bacterium]|nr:hypothetical protein [Crocinitomicaceae bacterium]
MNKNEAKELVIKHINVFFESQGYKLVKKADSSVVYQKNMNSGFDGFASGTVDYNPIQKIRYSFYKRIESIEEITYLISQKVKLNPPIDKKTISLAFGYDSLILGKYVDTYLPECKVEEDVAKCVQEIIGFAEMHALPLLEKANDIRYLDAQINGEIFWETDWQQKFNLGGNFDIKRLIVAWLANNPNFNEIVEKNYNAIEKASELSGYPFKYNRQDLSLPIPCALEILKSIKPLF